MARGGQQGDPTDWVTRAADDAVRHAGEGKPVTVASGASPSGPIHLGKIREFLTPHFVAEELRGRGVEVRHLHSWDDFDRLRRVPVEADPSFAEHIGRPLSAVPDPWGEYPSWAERWKAPLRSALTELGVEMEEISQTERYRSGAYRAQIRTAIDRRVDIEETLARYRTKGVEPAASLGSAEDSDSEDGDDDDDETLGATADLQRFPYKPYCAECGRDTVTLTAWDDPVLSYRCNAHPYEGSIDVDTEDDGKLVWKVDWPMRWAYEGVDFEPGGLDHSTPGSSYTVGKEVVSRIYGGVAPAFVSYNFVGIAGMPKMSSSKGGVPIPSTALSILEAPMVRWLYVRRAPKQAFNIDFGPEVLRLYDEWDALSRKAADPTRRDVQVLAWERAAATTSAGRLPTPSVPVPFRVLSSVADVTAGSAEQISRIVADVGYAHDSVDDLEPRLSRAMTWTAEYVDAADRTTVRATPSPLLASLSSQEQDWLARLLAGLPSPLALDAVTTLVYGVPKLARGLSLDDPPTDGVKADQKEFFTLLYRLLVDAERGPRLPTLIMALGHERVRALLTA